MLSYYLFSFSRTCLSMCIIKMVPYYFILQASWDIHLRLLCKTIMLVDVVGEASHFVILGFKLYASSKCLFKGTFSFKNLVTNE